MKKTILAIVAVAMCMAATAQIRVQPEGELLKGLEYCSKGMVPDYSSGQVSRFDETGVIANVVRNGDKFYIKDPITHYRTSTWMEGQLSSDGTQVVFTLPQVYTTEQGTTYYLNRLVQNGQSLSFDAFTNALVFSYVDGTLTQTDGGYLSITNAAGRTTSYVEYGIVIRPVGHEFVCPPAEATHASYVMSYQSEGAPMTKTVDVAFSGDQVYIANPTGAEDSWIHGTLDGDRIICPNGQFLGADETLGYYAYLKDAVGSVEIINIPGLGDWPVSTIKLTDAEAVVFAWNEADRSFSTEQLFLVNTASDRLADQYADFDKAAYIPYAEVAAVPADPVVLSCSGIIEGYGIGVFAINMPATDVDGNYINQDHMYYNIYLDNTVMKTIDGLTDIPYNYTDGQYIRVSGQSHTFTYTTPINDRIGVQVFYKVGDVVNSSNLVWYNLKADAIDTATVPDGMSTDYDLSGRRVAPGHKGLTLRRIHRPDGSVVTTKRFVR